MAQSSLQNNFGGVIVLLFVAAAWIGVQHLGYVEFGVAGRMFVDGAFRRHLQGQMTLHIFEASLMGAATPEDCWKILQTAAKEFGYDQVRARLAAVDFFTVRASEPPADGAINSWNVRIPPSIRQRLSFLDCRPEVTRHRSVVKPSPRSTSQVETNKTLHFSCRLP